MAGDCQEELEIELRFIDICLFILKHSKSPRATALGLSNLKELSTKPFTLVPR